MKDNIFGDLCKRYVFNQKENSMDKTDRWQLFLKALGVIVIMWVMGMIFKRAENVGYIIIAVSFVSAILYAKFKK